MAEQKPVNELNLDYAHTHYPEVELVEIDKRWDWNQQKYFEAVNQLKQLQDIENNLVEALVLGREAMIKANEERLAHSPTTVEPDDLINQRVIRLKGVDRDDLFELGFEQWLHEEVDAGRLKK